MTYKMNIAEKAKIIQDEKRKAVLKILIYNSPFLSSQTTSVLVSNQGKDI